MSVLKWNKVIIYYDLDTNYSPLKNEIDEFITSQFKDPIIYTFRNEYQKQWKIALEKLNEICNDYNDDLIWYCCNDDHIFIDYSLGLIREIENGLISLCRYNEFVACGYSHWPESLYSGKIAKIKCPNGTENNILTSTPLYKICLSNIPDSIQIVNFNLLRAWWFDHDYGDNTWMPRTDNKKQSVISPEFVCITPYRELVRHFDGYSHVKININVCPPLMIPEGFFENKIKILYCAPKRKKGFVHVNPVLKNYSTIEVDGADLKCMLEDLPLFWKSRIDCIEIANHIDKSILCKCRNHAVLKIAWQMGLIPLSVNLLKIAMRFNEPKDSRQELFELKLFRIYYMFVFSIPLLIPRLFLIIKNFTLSVLVGLRRKIKKSHVVI